MIVPKFNSPQKGTVDPFGLERYRYLLIAVSRISFQVKIISVSQRIAIDSVNTDLYTMFPW